MRPSVRPKSVCDTGVSNFDYVRPWTETRWYLVLILSRLAQILLVVFLIVFHIPYICLRLCVHCMWMKMCETNQNSDHLFNTLNIFYSQILNGYIRLSLQYKVCARTLNIYQTQEYRNIHFPHIFVEGDFDQLAFNKIFNLIAQYLLAALRLRSKWRLMLMDKTV